MNRISSFSARGMSVLTTVARVMRTALPGAIGSLLLFNTGFAADAKHTFALTVDRKPVSVGSGMTYDAWTYNGTLPGPTIKVTEGDELTVRLNNHTTDAHGLNVHGAQISPSHFGGITMDPLSYTFKAQVPGVFAYHCNALPILDHIAAGMYGPLIVGPKGGWPNGPAQEFTIVQGELYGIPDANHFIKRDHNKMVDSRPDFVIFNGEVNKYDLDHPMPIQTGKLVRVFFLNAGPNLTSAFHVAGVIFKTVYQGGNPANALHGMDSLSVSPEEGAVFEFQVNEAGNYRFMDLQQAHQYRGAMGTFKAVAQ